MMGEQDWDYQPRYAYALSKLANCLHAVELARFVAYQKATITYEKREHSILMRHLSHLSFSYGDISL